MRNLIIAGLILSSVTPALAAGDPAHGRVLAQSICRDCHVIEALPGKKPAAREPNAPPHFDTIANDPAITEKSIRSTLQLPHGPMNNVLVTSKEADDVIGYIFTMRK